MMSCDSAALDLAKWDLPYAISCELLPGICKLGLAESKRLGQVFSTLLNRDLFFHYYAAALITIGVAEGFSAEDLQIQLMRTYMLSVA